MKVLDFGLAKAIWGADEKSGPVAVDHRDRTGNRGRADRGHASVHEPGAGARGRVDKRTDIWAFGCLLYELLTGKRAFRGETLTGYHCGGPGTRARLGRAPGEDSAKVRELLQRCLQKNQARRVQDIKMLAA